MANIMERMMENTYKLSLLSKILDFYDGKNYFLMRLIKRQTLELYVIFFGKLIYIHTYIMSKILKFLVNLRVSQTYF